MSMNTTPRSERTHIAILGKTNAGKSSLINALTDQNHAIVSDVKGTTTDPVYKSMEIFPIGPVVIIDTAGYDDISELGDLRKEKSLNVLKKADICLLVWDATLKFDDTDINMLKNIKEKNVPVLIVANHIDKVSNIEILNKELNEIEDKYKVKGILVSAKTKKGIDKIKEKLGQIGNNSMDTFKIVGDLISPSDIVVLVTPIDKGAPKGRLIMPQQQTIRDILESDAICIVTKEHELRQTLDSLKTKPKLVITDSQAFLKVSADTPKDIMLTSFSILFARYKGDLIKLVEGVKAIEKLKDGDKVLISEGCTHHRQADDIGKVKIPRWIRQMTGKEIDFDFTSGYHFDVDITKYKLVVHCGACMLNKAEMMNRIETVTEKNIPIVNYGILISYVKGIMDRALEPFPLAKMIYDEM